MSSSPDWKTSAIPQRFHHLDALRAFAMLLGLVLHGFMSFIVIPFWPAQDIHPNDDLYGFLLYAIHGFRMQLFFLISGFFTAMLWRRRGAKGLLKNRAIRILVPLVAGVILLAIPMIAITVWGNATKEKNAQSSQTENSIWSASRSGNTKAIRNTIGTGADINSQDESGMTPLTWAALNGDVETMGFLASNGADVNARAKDGASPLHSAAFLGRSEAVDFLLKKGADVNQRNDKGESPIDAAKAPWEVTAWVAGMLKIELDREEVTEGREAVIEMLEAAGLESKGDLAEKRPFDSLVRIWTFGATVPFFHHLWFLYYLCLLACLFLLLAPLLARLPAKVASGLTHPVFCALWLIPLTFAAQFLMRQTFGPDTATGPLPWPPKLFYYAIFFGFGALCFGKESFEQRAGKFWPIHFLVAIPVLLAGIYFFEIRAENFSLYHPLASLLEAIYAWLMIYAFLGFFRRFFSTENPKIRYLSDSAYWLYLAHLPLVMALQILVSGWDFPGPLKLLGILIVTTAILLLSYHWFVRYTWIGAILNGRKTRPE